MSTDLTCLLRNLYAGQEVTVKTRHGTTDWLQIGKGVCQGCILSPCLFNLYIESVSQFSLSVVSDSLQPHKSQHTRPPCPSPTPGVYPNPCRSSRWCHPIISSSVVPSSSCPPIPPSIRVFSNESTLHIRWPKYWSFSFSISPSNEHPGLISFRMDWLDLLAVQGTLKSLIQDHSLKASILLHSAFFTVQLSHPYITTRKTIAYVLKNHNLVHLWLDGPLLAK